MVGVFITKIRKIGSSAGVLIPQDELYQTQTHIGDTVKIAILPKKKDFSGFGFAKNARVPFKRDKKVRDFI